MLSFVKVYAPVREDDVLGNSLAYAQCSLHLLGLLLQLVVLKFLPRQLFFLLLDSVFELLVPLSKGLVLCSEPLQLLVLCFELLHFQLSSVLLPLGDLLRDGRIVGFNFGAQDPLPCRMCRLFFFGPYSLCLFWN